MRMRNSSLTRQSIFVALILILASSPRRSLFVAPVASNADENVDKTVDAVEVEGDDDAMYPIHGRDK